MDSGSAVKTVNGNAPDENGNEEIEIPEVDLSGYAKTEDIPSVPENIVQSVNGNAPDENGNVQIEVPDSGGNVAYDTAQELTDEQKAQARENIGAQPVGDYLTEVPEGYAKTEDIPTKVSELENDSGYLTEHQSLDGYAKTEDIPSLDGYAKTEDIPTDDHINELINTALAAIPDASEVAY